MCFQGEASQNGGRTSEKLILSGFEVKEDKREQDEGKGGFQATREEPGDSILDETNKNTPQGSKQGKVSENTTKLNIKAKTTKNKY